MKRESVGVLMVFVASAGFGTLAIFGKYAEVAGLNTTTLLTYRFALGTVFLWAGLALWGRARRLRGRRLRIALGLGILYAMFSMLFFWGLLFVPAGVAAIAFYTYPVLVYLLSMTLLDERLTRRRLVALIIAITGVILITGGNTADVNLLGVALVILAAAGFAFYIVGSRAALASIEADLLAGTALIATTISFLLFGAISGRLSIPGGTDQWLIIVGIAAVGTAVPLFLYVSGLDRIEASRAAIISTSEPVVTVALGIALLDELLTLPLVAGGGLVLVGVGLIQSEIAGERRAAQ